MYFERKIDRWLIDWKNRKEKSPALIVGIRQCGKTESIEHFAGQYKKLVKLNFWDNPEYCSDFDGELDVDIQYLPPFPSCPDNPGRHADLF